MKKLVLVAAFMASGSIWVHADIIYFKDGMTTVCHEKAWEENGEIKCEYEGLILNYRKADVLRIEKKRTEKPVTQKTDKQKTVKESGKKAITRLKTPSASSGLVFYDPRRTHKYWSSEISKHNTFHEAIAALAKHYDRSPEWVQTHMGETNDLNEIHQNLKASKLNDHQTEIKAKSKTSKTIEFYNPRRTYKYWSSETSKHNTFHEAIAALAKQYDRSPEWVQTHMGETNDLNEIHQNLMNYKLRQSTQQRQD